MASHALEALRAVCDDVVVVSSRPAPEEWGRVIPDLRPGLGPLAGIEAALHWARARGMAGVFVLAADLPRVTAPLVDRLVGSTEARRLDGSRPGAVAAARRGDPAFEPLCALYSVACAAEATRLLDEGQRAARALFEAVGGEAVALDDAAAGAVSANVNTPADLDRLS